MLWLWFADWSSLFFKLVLADSLASILVLPIYVTLVILLLAMLSKTSLLAAVVSSVTIVPSPWYSPITIVPSPWYPVTLESRTDEEVLSLLILVVVTLALLVLTSILPLPIVVYAWPPWFIKTTLSGLLILTLVIRALEIILDEFLAADIVTLASWSMLISAVWLAYLSPLVTVLLLL